MTQNNNQFHNDHSYSVKLSNITASFTARNYQRNLVTLLEDNLATYTISVLIYFSNHIQLLCHIYVYFLV